MASLPMFFGASTTGAVFKATAAKGGSKEEKSLLDFVLGNLTKQDQFYETDPVLKKVEEKAGTGTGTTGSGRKGTVSVQPKKKSGSGGGLGGLFAKK
ncbi:hypothetical protein vseg_004238 [Gypsophila vaccaria]